MSTPKITIDLACESATEYATLAPMVALGFANYKRQLKVDTKKDYTLEVAPYAGDARAELEQAAERYSAAMARSPAAAAKIKSLLDRADGTDCVLALAAITVEVNQAGNSPLFWS